MRPRYVVGSLSPGPLGFEAVRHPPLPSPFCRTGRRPGRPGCTKSSGTAIASWPAKMATASMGAHDVGLLRCFHPHRTAVAALPVDTAVLDGEANVLRSDHTSDFVALRSRQGAG
jgi:hypothetical protein